MSAVVGGMLCKSDKPSIIIIIITTHEGLLLEYSYAYATTYAFPESPAGGMLFGVSGLLSVLCVS